MIKNFNNLLALILVIMLIILFALQGLNILNLPGEINGAMIAAFTLVIQYYYRKSPPVESGIITEGEVPGCTGKKK
jgi:ACR3 family arsenite efflux pump ArsB